MERMTEKRIVAIRPIAYIIGLVWVIIATIFTSFVAMFTVGGSLWGLHPEAWSNNWVGFISFGMWWPVILTTIMSAMARGLRLTRQEFAIIISMVWVTWMIPSMYGILPSVTHLGTARQIPAFHRWNLEYARDINWQFGPDPYDPSLWDSWMYGGPVPWGAWMPSLVWNIIRILPFYLMYAFLASLWRRQWLDIEVLPFPYASATSSMIDMVYEKGEEQPRFLSNKYLWLGVLVGFLAIMPYWAWTIPTLGQYVAQPTNYCGIYIVDLTPYVIVPLANLNFNVEAFLIGAAFLVPLKTLFSYIVTSIAINWVWWPIMSWMGLWEPQSAGTHGMAHGLFHTIWRDAMGPNMRAWVRQWGAVAWLGIGAGFGLMFYPVLVAFRGETLNVLRAIVGKAPKEVEEREPMKFSLLFTGFIGLLLVYIATWYVSSLGNLPIIFGLIWTTANGLLYMGEARVAGEYGRAMDVLNEQIWSHNWDTTAREWWVADPNSPFYIRDLQTRFIVLKTDIPWFFTHIRAAPMSTLLETYKIGALQGVHAKQIFNATMLAVVVSVILSLFVLLQFICIFGIVNLANFNFTGAPHNYYQRAPTYGAITEVGDYWREGLGKLPVPGQWLLFFIGALIVSVVYFLQGRFPWFPLNAAGVTMGFGWMPVLLLTPSIIAYVAKRIIIRVGGAELYEKRAVPFAVGMMAATGFAILMGLIRTYMTTIGMM